MKNVTILSLLIISIAAFFMQDMAEGSPLFNDGEKLYQHYCSPCHGKKGDGKGFNARNLDPRPAVHSDAEFMRTRTDKELFDAIYGGGKAVGKSTLMPPWGDTFSETQINNLILYLRKLCKCKGF